MKKEDNSYPETEGIALMLVDIQSVFLEVIPDKSRFLGRCCFAVEAAKLLNIPMIFTTQAARKLGPIAPEMRPYLPDSAMVLDKATFSALEDDKISDWIEDNKYEHLIIGGLEIPICIYQTLISALNREIGVTLMTDCLSCRRTEDGKAVLRFFKGFERIVSIPSETMFYALLQHAEHPLFKEFTKLVKKYSQDS